MAFCKKLLPIECVLPLFGLLVTERLNHSGASDSHPGARICFEANSVCAPTLSSCFFHIASLLSHLHSTVLWRVCVMNLLAEKDQTLPTNATALQGREDPFDEMVDPNHVLVASIGKKYLPAKKRALRRFQVCELSGSREAVRRAYGPAPGFPRFQIVMLPLGVPLTTTISSAPSRFKSASVTLWMTGNPRVGRPLS